MVARPALLELGGEEAFAAYQAEFDRLYRSGSVVDVLGRRVVFMADAAEHVCFKSKEEDNYGRLLQREVWSQERAERIPWIGPALCDPGIEVRPSHRVKGREVYLLLIPADPRAGHGLERFCVVVEPLAADRVRFLTAYPVDERYWQRTRDAGRCLYPPAKAAPKVRRGKRR